MTTPESHTESYPVTYEVTATREGSWWVLDVEGVGVTQCRRLTEARAQVLGLVEAVTDADVPEETRVEVHLEDELGEAVNDARESVRAAAVEQARAAERSRAAVRQLVDAGLPQSDIAVVLGVSKQRVSQLVRPDHHRAADLSASA